MADKECNYKNNDHCTIDTNYCAPNNTGQHCFIRKYVDERQENKALKAENERLRKASKEGLFNLTKAHEVARMVDIRLNPENSVNKEDFLNHISEGYLFNQSTISLLDDAKAALQPEQESDYNLIIDIEDFKQIKESCANPQYNEKLAESLKRPLQFDKQEESCEDCESYIDNPEKCINCEIRIKHEENEEHNQRLRDMMNDLGNPNPTQKFI